MFDLEKQIARWRRQTEKSVGRQDGRLDELESHLRDQVEQLLKTGLTPEEAFHQAVARLGDPGAISAEFRKTRSAAWRPARVAFLLWVVLAVAAGLLLLASVAESTRDLLLAVHVYSITLGYCGALITGGLGACFVIQNLFDQGQKPGRVATDRNLTFLGSASALLTGLGFILGMFWSKSRYGSYWTWDPREIGGAVVLVWLSLMWVWRRFGQPGPRWFMLMGITGGTLTTLAWFGPWTFGQGSAYGGLVTSSILKGVLLLQNAILFLGFLPPGCLAWKRRV